MDKSIIQSINICDLICRKIISKPLPHIILTYIFDLVKFKKVYKKQNIKNQISDDNFILKGSHKFQRYYNGYKTKVKIKRCLRYR